MTPSERFLAAHRSILQVIEAHARTSIPLKAAAYARSSLRMWSQLGVVPDPVALARRFPAWQRTMRADGGPITLGVPWMAYSAIEHLEGLLRPSMRVFEWGSGGSSLFFARRTASGVSIEHDRAWSEITSRALADAGLLTWEVRHVPPSVAEASAASGGRSAASRSGDAADPGSFWSSDAAYEGMSFEAYARAVDRIENASLNVVIVDGRARPACVARAIPKLAPGGTLVLDNSERATYARALAAVDALGWGRRDFVGPAPGAFTFSRTTMWRRSG